MLENEAIISIYTRAQAIEDGVLIDVSETAREAGLRFPVAITTTAWQAFIVPDDTARDFDNSTEGRLWDTLTMLRVYARGGGQLISFPVIYLFACNAGQACVQQTKTLIAHCGPGDMGEPVITIMLPGED
jgi:hypothetical protein